MNWFSKRFGKAPIERKRAQSAPFLAFHHPFPGMFSEKQGAGLIRAGFHRNAIVYRCVRLIAESAASIAITLNVAGKETRGHRLEGLLNRPNPRESGAAMLEAIFGHLLLSGNAYCEVVLDGMLPVELYSLRPDRVRVLARPDGWVESYEYSAGGRSRRIAAEAEPVSTILHLKLDDPMDDHYGFAPLSAAQMALETHEAATRWNKALLENSARPSGALVYSSPENLSEDQFERLKSELETAFQGASNAGRPVLLEGGLDWKPLSLSPKDMDFLEARSGAAREIALAFGVPPLLLGLPGDNTFANYAEAQRAFHRSTLLPLVRRTYDAISHWLQPLFPETIRIAPDLDQIEVLAEERAALWARVSAAEFLTEQEKREAVGYGARIAPLNAPDPLSKP
jgi:HK97 family phage portal protein